MAESDININEMRAIAQQGQAAHKFWARISDVLDAVPIAQNLVNEATAKKTQLQTELVALQDKVRAAADDAKGRLAQIDRELSEKVANAQAAAAAVVAAQQNDIATWQSRVTVEEAKYEALVKGQEQASAAAKERADALLRQTQEEALALSTQAATLREAAGAELADFRAKTSAEKRAKTVQLDSLNAEIQTAQARLDALRTELKLAREKFATVLDAG
jgi:hypothetical protein